MRLQLELASDQSQVMFVTMMDGHAQIKASRPYGALNSFKIRPCPARLPSGNHGLVRTKSFTKFPLGQASALSGFCDEQPSVHSQMLYLIRY